MTGPATGTTRAEVVKFARLLRQDPARFDYLAALPPAAVRVLRERATEALFAADAAVYQRIAAASRLVPDQVTAAIAQRAFGAMLCARVAGALDPVRAADLAARLPEPFLADVAAELDPRAVPALLPRLPVARLRAVARELVRRGDHVTMGRFIGPLSAESLRALVTDLAPADMLRTAVYSDDFDRLPRVFALVPDGDLPELLDAAVRHEHPEDVVAVFSALDPQSRARLARAAEGDPEAVALLSRVLHPAGDKGETTRP